MKQIQETTNSHKWPRKKVNSIECRERDFVIRIADWTRDRDEPVTSAAFTIGMSQNVSLFASMGTS